MGEDDLTETWTDFVERKNKSRLMPDDISMSPGSHSQIDTVPESIINRSSSKSLDATIEGDYDRILSEEEKQQWRSKLITLQANRSCWTFHCF